MTNEDKVRTRYPHASAELDGWNVWSVWDVSRDEQQRLNDLHYPDTFSRGLFGIGDSEAEAWANAVSVIECREGRKL